MGLNGPHYELIYHYDTVYKGWIGFKFIFVYKGILIITKAFIRSLDWAN